MAKEGQFRLGRGGLAIGVAALVLACTSKEVPPPGRNFDFEYNDQNRGDLPRFPADDVDRSNQPRAMDSLRDAGAIQSGGDAGATPPGPGGGGACQTANLAFPVNRMPADVLIVLDRSLSMGLPPNGGGDPRWIQVAGAVAEAVVAHEQDIHFGLSLFPTDDLCGVSGSLVVPVGPQNAPEISATFGQYEPQGATPTRFALEEAGRYLSTLNDGRAKFVLLATDGIPNCKTCDSPYCMYVDFDEEGTIAAADALANQGIHTIVVGLALEVFADNSLNNIALAGREARPGAVKYYAADTRAALSSTLHQLSRQVVECQVALPFVPHSEQTARVKLSGQLVRRDPSRQEGWEYGPGNTSVRFYGSFCQNIMGQAPGAPVLPVEVRIGCPND